MGFGPFEDTAVVGRRSFGEFNPSLEVRRVLFEAWFLISSP
jgi:hypothetical protein